MIWSGTYVASPTESPCVPTSLSNIFAINSVVPSETEKINVSFHSGVVPCPARIHQIFVLTTLEAQRFDTESKSPWSWLKTYLKRHYSSVLESGKWRAHKDPCYLLIIKPHNPVNEYAIDFTYVQKLCYNKNNWNISRVMSITINKTIDH